MNYQALDEALEYLDNRESVNEGKEALVGIFAVISAAILGVVLFIKGKALKSEIDLAKAVKDPETQSKFKKLFSSVSKALESALKKYDKFIKYNSYSYKFESDTKEKKVTVKFPVCTIKAADLFKDIYKMDMDTYNKDFGEAEDYGKSAPEFKKQVTEINTISKSICSKLKTGAVVTKLEIPKSDLEGIEREYIYFDNGDSENSKLEIMMTLVFDYEKLKSKE